MLAHVSHWPIPFINSFEDYLYDLRVRLSMPGTTDQRVVIVDLDEKSLSEVGRWPWGRNIVADLVKRLTDEYAVAVVGFDVVFAEPDYSSGLPTLEKIGREQLKHDQGYLNALKNLRTSLNYDQQFADILKGRPVVLGYYFNHDPKRQNGALPLPVFPQGYFAGRPVYLEVYQGYGGNLSFFQDAALSGHFNPTPDSDGVSRRVPLVVEYEGAYYEALSIAILRTLLNDVTLRPVYGDDRSWAEWLELTTAKEALRVPVNESLAALVPFRGRQQSFPYVSAADVLKGKVNPALMRGKIVLVGTSAPGLKDLRVTPVEPNYPGVEIHANMIAGMLDGTVKQRPAYVDGIEVVQLLVTGGLLTFLLPVLSPIRSSMLALGTLSALLGVNYLFWQSGNLVVPLASGLILILLLYAANMSWGYFVESKTKRQFTQLFGQYVPPELVEEMARDPENYSMEGKKEELTVFFSDVRGFTTISEGLDSKELSQLMNEYLGAMTAIIRKHRGTLDKYMGDAIMAFWGAPVSDSEHARNAVLTALEMMPALRQLDESFKSRGWPTLHIGVGINTGAMTVGDLGSSVRQSYTVMGDAVNLASRLEGITKEYGVAIIVGENTCGQVKDVVFREIDRVRVKGKDAPVAIYEPLGLTGALNESVLDDLKLWQRALRLYRAQDWEQAELQLFNLGKRQPDCRLYQRYAERIAYLRAHPPGENWDGVTNFQTK